MKEKILFLIIFSSLTFLYSCDELFDFLNKNNIQISEEEIIDGLKTALKVGTDTAVTETSVTDGYYGNKIIKILLPSEADIIINNINTPTLQALGIPELVENVILRINRAAEDAAAEARPIFYSAITNMTIYDGLNILYGQNPLDSLSDSNVFDSIAATKYLKGKTFDQLFELFKPKMYSALNKKIISNISANDAWNTLVNTYNKVVENDVFGLLNLKKVNTDLGKHVTNKALEGLFYIVSVEEKKIRLDPKQWSISILQKIFGFVKDNPDINAVSLN
jgi:hypothetical protein